MAFLQVAYNFNDPQSVEVSFWPKQSIKLSSLVYTEVRLFIQFHALKSTRKPISIAGQRRMNSEKLRNLPSLCVMHGQGAHQWPRMK